jgi:hypothetical protein
MYEIVRLLERSRGVKVGPQTAAQRAVATSGIEALLKYASSERSSGRDRCGKRHGRHTQTQLALLVCGRVGSNSGGGLTRP